MKQAMLSALAGRIAHKQTGVGLCRPRTLSTTGRSRGCCLEIDAHVQSALRAGRPVVALESTIVAHGMPYPENWHLSQRLATLLRRKGVEPATIGTYIHACVSVTP